MAPFSVGRIRNLIPELLRGMRIMKNLIDSFACLNWSQNPNGDWCNDENQFLSKMSYPAPVRPQSNLLKAELRTPIRCRTHLGAQHQRRMLMVFMLHGSHAAHSGRVFNFEHKHGSRGWVSEHHEQRSAAVVPASDGPQKGMPAE